jgi:conjugal transfer ATP-binding protein TraC
MTDGDEATVSEMVEFPPRMGSLATKVGPLTVTQACYLMGSATLGASLAYAIDGLAPHSGWGMGAGILAFLGVLVVGACFGFVRRSDLPLFKFLVLRQRFRSRPSQLEGERTQVYVQVAGLTHDTLVLPNDVYVRIVEVEGVNFGLLSSTDQSERVQGFLTFLNGLDFDIQIITRPDRFDNRSYLRTLLARHDSERSPLLQRLTADYMRFFDEATSETLDRKFYVATSARLPQVARHLYENGKCPSAEVKREAAGRVLDARIASLVDELATLGLDAEPLEGKRLVEMLRSYYQFGVRAGGPAPGPVRSLVEALRPSKVVFHPDHTVVGKEFVRVLQVHDFPARLPQGFLTSLLTAPARVDVTLHVSPIAQEMALTMLRQEVVRLEVERLGKVEKGSVDTLALQHQLEVFEGIRSALTRQEERLFRTGLYISMRADSLEELDALTAQVQGTLRGLMVKARAPVFQQEKAIRSTLPFGRDHLETDYPLQGSAIATMYPFVSAVMSQEDGVLYGFSEVNETPLIFNRFSMENYNTCIFGASGSGKSYSLKSEILRQLILRPTLRVYVVDPLGEFGDLTRSLEGAVLRVGPKESTFLNPMWVGRSPGERAERAKSFFEVLMDLTQEERALLDGVLSRMYRERREEFVLGDLAAELAKARSAHADRLVLLLEPYLTGSYSFLNHRTTVDLSARMVTFDLNALMTQSRAVLVPVMFVVLDFISARCAEDMEPKILAVDEAWYLMGRPESAQFLSNLARHSRHSKTGVTLISQTAEDFLNDERGRVILANSCITTLFRHKSISPGMREHFGLTPTEVHLVKFAKTGKDTGYSTALFTTSTTRTPMRVEAAEFEHWLITSDPDEVKAKFQEQASAAPKETAARPASPAPTLAPAAPRPSSEAPQIVPPEVAVARRRPADPYPSYFAAASLGCGASLPFGPTPALPVGSASVHLLSSTEET